MTEVYCLFNIGHNDFSDAMLYGIYSSMDKVFDQIKILKRELYEDDDENYNTSDYMTLKHDIDNNANYHPEFWTANRMNDDIVRSVHVYETPYSF